MIFKNISKLYLKISKHRCYLYALRRTQKINKPKYLCLLILKKSYEFTCFVIYVIEILENNLFVLPMQLLSLHPVTSIEFPVQKCPIGEGVGLVHVLDLFLNPPPQEVEHWPQLDQIVHPPSIDANNIILN